MPAATSTPPSASTKFRPPTSTRPLVVRRRLIDTLQSGAHRRLVLIHAPAGFGKSTLASQWRGVLVEDGASVAWLSVDPDDNNVVWFLAHLVEAVRQVRPPALARELGQILEDHPPPDAARYVLSSLIDEIHSSGERLVVVIDDWHRVSADETIEAMDFLLDHGCHHLQLVVTSRTQAGLPPLSRMRVSDELVEIDPDALRFDASEAKAFLLDVNGLRLSESEVTELAIATDGWRPRCSWHRCRFAAGTIRQSSSDICLDGIMPSASISWQRASHARAPPTRFPDGHGDREKVCGDLAAKLTGLQSGQALLEEAEGRDLFLTSIDDDKEWFRYHHLFAEFLQRRLERVDPARARELHLTASTWFEDHGMLSEAVDHVMAAKDFDRAAHLVESGGMELIENSRMATLLGLVAKLPPPLWHTIDRVFSSPSRGGEMCCYSGRRSCNSRSTVSLPPSIRSR